MTQIKLPLTNPGRSIGMLLEPHYYSLSEPMNATKCNIGFENCTEIGKLSIEFTGEEGNNLEGDYFIKNNGSTLEGNFLIKRCMNERLLCG